MERYRLGAGSVLVLEQGDLTRSEVDAIVNAANERMLGGGGVDGAIHRAAGPALRAACEQVSEVRPGVRCPTGEARMTGGFGLPAAHVIHTVGPVYRGGSSGERELLESCYRRCMETAAANDVKSLAFPSISTGAYGYPIEDASEIALGAVVEQLERFPEIEKVYFCLFSDKDWNVYQDRLTAL